MGPGTGFPADREKVPVKNTEPEFSNAVHVLAVDRKKVSLWRWEYRGRCSCGVTGTWAPRKRQAWQGLVPGHATLIFREMRTGLGAQDKDPGA